MTPDLVCCCMCLLDTAHRLSLSCNNRLDMGLKFDNKTHDMNEFVSDTQLVLTGVIINSNIFLTSVGVYSHFKISNKICSYQKYI